MWDNIANSTGELFGNAAEAGGNVYNAVVDGAEDVGEAVGEFAEDVVDIVAGGAEDAADAGRDAATSVFIAVKEAGTSFLNNPGQVIQETAARFGQVVGEVGTVAVDGTVAAIGQAGKVLGDVADDVKVSVEFLLETGANTVEAGARLGNDIAGTVKDGIEQAEDMIEQAEDTIEEIIRTIGDSTTCPDPNPEPDLDPAELAIELAKEAGRVIGGGVGIVKDGVDALGDAVESGKDAVEDAVKEAEAVLGELVGKVADTAKDAVEAGAAAVENMFDLAAEAVEEANRFAGDLAEDAARLAGEIGGNVVKSVEDAIEDTSEFTNRLGEAFKVGFEEGSGDNGVATAAAATQSAGLTKADPDDRVSDLVLDLGDMFEPKKPLFELKEELPKEFFEKLGLGPKTPEGIEIGVDLDFDAGSDKAPAETAVKVFDPSFRDQALETVAFAGFDDDGPKASFQLF